MQKLAGLAAILEDELGVAFLREKRKDMAVMFCLGLYLLLCYVNVLVVRMHKHK